MENIYYKKILVAQCIRTIPAGSIPQTDGAQPLQLVTLKHPKGTYLKAHTHIPKKRVTTRMQECLIVRKGTIKIDLYAPDKTCFIHVTLKQGEILILVNGGYGIQLLTDSEMIEVKNGPFIEDKVLI